MKGPVFGRYAVEQKLASGGMGEVYLASDGTTQQLVILKVLRRDLIRDQQAVLQFLDEVRISAQLHHPNVVSVFDVGDWQDEIVMAMEYIPGHDCAALLKQAQSRLVTGFPIEVAAQILLDAASGLDYVHAARDLKGQPLKVVHRDISPQNLMVREDGLTKILDFGVARAEARIVRTMQGVVKGKLSYMSPEQVKGLSITGQVDQFALGVVGWELLSVQRLFKGTSDVDSLNMVMDKPVPPPSTLSPEVPPELDRVILRMLERDPQHRYPTCSEVARALAPFAGGRSTVAGFRRSLGLANPSEKFKGHSVITEGQGVPLPRASPAAPPRASPAAPARPSLSAMPRASPARPRSVPPRAAATLPGPVALGDVGSSLGTEEHHAVDEQRPGIRTELHTDRVTAGVRPTNPASQVTQPPTHPEDGGPPTLDLRAPRVRDLDSTTEGEGEPLPPEPATHQGRPLNAAPRTRWWMMALAGLGALGLGAGVALAVIRILINK